MEDKGVPGNKPQQQKPGLRGTRVPSRDAAVGTGPEMHSGKQKKRGLAQFGKGGRFGRGSGVPVPALQQLQLLPDPLQPLWHRGSASPRWDPAGIKESKGTKGSVLRELGLCWVLGDPGEAMAPCRQQLPPALPVQEPLQPGDAAGVMPEQGAQEGGQKKRKQTCLFLPQVAFSYLIFFSFLSQA